MNSDATEEIRALFGQGKLFTHPKPSKLLHHFVKIATTSNNEDIILDFFSGSATTAHAVMQLNAEDGGNRKFIMVQLPEVAEEKSEAYKAGYTNICEIGKERIRRAGAKILEEHTEKTVQQTIDGSETSPPDIGFRVLKLDTSNLHAWDGTPIGDGNLQTLFDRFDAREKPSSKTALIWILSLK